MFCSESVSTELVYITAFGGRNSWESLRVLLRTAWHFPEQNCASQQSPNKTSGIYQDENRCGPQFVYIFFLGLSAN